jgi:hypothetical protein
MLVILRKMLRIRTNWKRVAWRLEGQQVHGGNAILTNKKKTYQFCRLEGEGSGYCASLDKLFLVTISLPPCICYHATLQANHLQCPHPEAVLAENKI